MDEQMRIVFLFILISSSATEKVKNLTGTEGGSITLPDPVVKEGFLLFGGKTVAMVINGNSKIYEGTLKDKVLWDKSTGLFTITGLQRNDSGIYVIDPKTGIASTTTYQLTVYEPVPPPAVKSVNVSTESCILLCWVEKAEGTTLLWYKDEEIVNQSSSAFSLPLTVLKQDFNSSYRCVSANPAEKKTALVNVSTTCSGQISPANNKRQYLAAIVIPIILTVIVVLAALIVRSLNKNRTTTTHTQGRFRETHRGAVY
ncbi:SLAM family member 8 isoform X2 [Dicentrarchus labrax]|uniref:SLAM family member 8 isoform X2 n=1 Tax=Dicentrarchus labrax TaxID=13489 RepID=UPI0021F57806|nr:SLAM family member 8 isoform X2 [Dicentrarchus labrax]